MINHRCEGKDLWSGLAICVLILLGVKLTVLFFPSEMIFGESAELFRGVLAKQIVSNNRVESFFDYLYNPYAGGSLVISILTVPFFLIFGQTVFSLKLVEVLFSILSLSLIYVILYKNFGKKTALIAAFMFILPCQYFAQRSIMAIGDYCESVFFSFLVIYLFITIITDGREGKHNKIWHPFLFGLIAGLGIWFHYVVGIALATCLIIWILVERRLFIRKNFLGFLAGFIFGFSPWILFNLNRHFEGCIAGRGYIWSHFFRGGILHSISRLFQTFVSTAPNLLMFKNNFLNGFLILFYSRVYYFIFIFAFIGLLFRYRDKIKLLLARQLPDTGAIFVISALLYSVLFMIIYGLYAIPTTITGIGFHDYRRFMPMFPFMIIVISVFFAPYLSVKKSKYPVLLFSLPFLAFSYGILNSAALFSFGNFGKAFSMPGYSYRLLGINIADSSLRDIARWVKVIRTESYTYKDQVCYGIGEGIGQDLGDDIPLGKIDAYQELLNPLDEKCLQDIYYGMGVACVDAVKYNTIELSQVVKKINQPYIKNFTDGYNSKPK